MKKMEREFIGKSVVAAAVIFTVTAPCLYHKSATPT
jgi:hypothetical protein